MAGSFNHIVGDDGKFCIDFIENMGDAGEALLDCFNLIVEISGGDMERLVAACKKTKQPEPKTMPIHTDPSW